MNKHPDLITGNPFKLPGHMLCSRKSAQECGDEIIAEARNGQVVVRLLQSSAKFCPAKPPTQEERVADALASGHKLARDLDQLYAKARQGDAKALWRFIEITIGCCEKLSDIAHSNPQAIRPFARNSVRWPLMKSTHPLNCDPDRLLRDIELGVDAGVQIDKYSKWKPDYAATFALRLFEHIRDLRDAPDATVHVPKQSPMPFKKWLPSFTRENAPQWWDLAWKFLLASYPHPERVSELDQLVTSPSKRKSPGRRKQAIHDVLKRRFLALAKA